jgi:hypothetical protein
VRHHPAWADPIEPVAKGRRADSDHHGRNAERSRDRFTRPAKLVGERLEKDAERLDEPGNEEPDFRQRHGEFQ